MKPAAKRVLVSALSLVSIAVASAAPRARADVTKDQCIDANGKGQQLRRAGKLAAARQQFRACATAACPAIVRDDCTKRMDDVERAQPTVVFDVKDSHGQDLTSVHVSIDGAPLIDSLDGRPLDVDPGKHEFVFEASGRSPVTQTFVIRESDKDIHERVVVDGGEPVATVAPSAPKMALPGADTSSDAARGRRVAGAVLAASGAVGVGVGAAFGVLALNKIADQNNDCQTSPCPRTSYAQGASDHSAAETDRLISIVGFAAGGALLVSGAALYFASPAATPVPQAGYAIVPTAGPGGASIQLKGSF